jgi:hypothetical protein
MLLTEYLSGLVKETIDKYSKAYVFTSEQKLMTKGQKKKIGFNKDILYVIDNSKLFSRNIWI